MDLVLEFTFDGQLDKPLMIGEGPYGTRAFFPVRRGTQKVTVLLAR